MGYGKLWVANRNEHDKIYLVDISNWDNINSSEKRVTCLIVDLNFDRLHSTLFSKDDTTFGEGLVRLWNGANANTDYDNIIGDYLWEPEPTNQYISSICETYSHQSHLGDGAGGGAANGDGKWRVCYILAQQTCNLPYLQLVHKCLCLTKLLRIKNVLIL